MNRHVKVLTLLLAAQLLVLAGILGWQQRHVVTSTGNFLQVDRASIDGVVIVDEKGQQLKLHRGDAGWTLPDTRGLPVDGDKITQLLDKLFAANAPWPVATSTESAKRFEVAPDKFQREIKLTNKDKVVADVYLGTSPGFKKVHARHAESDDIYAVGLANYDATARTDDWLDKALLKPTGDITAVVRPDHWKLQKAGDAWTLDGLAPGVTTKQDAVTDLVNKMANLRVMGPADAPPADGLEPALLLTVSTAGGEFDYRFYQPQPKSDFLVARSGQDGYFKLAAYIAEPLVTDRDDLSVAPSTPPAPAAAGPAPKSKATPVVKPTANPASR